MVLFHTHILLGIVFFLITRNFFSGGNEIIFFLFVLLGSILPDIDSKHSKINRWFGALGNIAVFFSKHRGFFHSIIFHLILFFVMETFFGFYYASGLLLGYTAHLVGDGITRAGLQIFYPFSKFKVKGPVRVGSFVEGLILLGLFLLIVKSFF